MTTRANPTTITRRKAEDVAQNTRASREVTPRVDVYENADELLMLADMPGASADSVHVRLEGEQLTLEAERALTSQSSIRYLRMFRMPATIDPDGISAELQSGVLHVHLKKSEASKPRTIPIRSS
jgi:HSP20 family molecular chaperone IbpA